MEVLGPWSLAVSKSFWEGFAPASLVGQHAHNQPLRTVFRSESDWSRVEAAVSQLGDFAHVTVVGRGDLVAAGAQVCRFLSLDIDAREWPAVGIRDPVIARAQRQLPGLRPCGFHSPYEAAAWAVLSQRMRIVQAARLREELVRHHGDHGAFPSPQQLLDIDLDLPGRKSEYLHSVAQAALDGLLDAATLRATDPDQAARQIRQIKGLGPFGAELVVIRGANAPDALPHHERRLDAEITVQYGPQATLAQVSGAWRPFRSWAAVYLRALREQRTHEIGSPPTT
ncbi:DNA-3-methyladenine glycosylase family protein [Mycobacterium marseillense]|uniref:DNA-3-methyladenine glycosylase family protein n=2 Tax=Mycobacterium TaxID=1763 RepID=UPI001F4FDDDA|nr:DNA-3-methyladenine glycosylase 2 family protein [Mycobacterium marseillense]